MTNDPIQGNFRVVVECDSIDDAEEVADFLNDKYYQEHCFNGMKIKAEAKLDWICELCRSEREECES